jgi:hypothetical protein
MPKLELLLGYEEIYHFQKTNTIAIASVHWWSTLGNPHQSGKENQTTALTRETSYLGKLSKGL